MERAEEEARREKWTHRFKEKGYAALVRTPDYSIVIPIVKAKDGCFQQSLPTPLRVTGKKSRCVSLLQLVKVTEARIIELAVLNGTPALAITDMPPPQTEGATRRERNVLAREADTAPVDEAAPPRFINPKKLLGKEDEWHFIPVPFWLSELNATLLEQMAYGRMIFMAGTDGVFRHSLRSLAKEMRCADSSISEAIRSLACRRLIQMPAGERSAKIIRFLYHPAMDHLKSAPLSGADGNESAPAGGALLKNKELKNHNDEDELDFRSSGKGVRSVTELEKLVASVVRGGIAQEREAWLAACRRNKWSTSDSSWARWMERLLEQNPPKPASTPPPAIEQDQLWEAFCQWYGMSLPFNNAPMSVKTEFETWKKGKNL